MVAQFALEKSTIRLRKKGKLKEGELKEGELKPNQFDTQPI